MEVTTFLLYFLSIVPICQLVDFHYTANSRTDYQMMKNYNEV